VSVDDEPVPGDGDEDAESTASVSVNHSPVISIIRPQLWVHWTITLLCGAIWGGMLYVGDLSEQADFGLKDILGIRSGRLTTFFSTIMLLWAGQLALLIYWYRRKSRNDFAGRYRMWLWIGAMLQFFLVVVATRAHHPFAEYMQQVWPAKIPRYDLLSWLVPISTLALAMYRLLRIELKRHRSGKFLLNLAALAAIVAATSLVVGPLLGERVRHLAQIGSATLAHLALATALLMHARYVVHVSNEVPRREKKLRRVGGAGQKFSGFLPVPKLKGVALPGLKLPRLTLPAMRLPTVKLPNLKRRRTKSVGKAQSEQQPPAAEATKASTQARSPQARKSPKSTRSDSAPAAETRAVPVSRKKKRQKPTPVDRRRIDTAHTSSQPQRSAPGQTRSLDDILDEFGSDGEIDAETLRGLSKKQRRRLRKKQRELQRAAG